MSEYHCFYCDCNISDYDAYTGIRVYNSCKNVDEWLDKLNNNQKVKYYDIHAICYLCLHEQLKPFPHLILFDTNEKKYSEMVYLGLDNGNFLEQNEKKFRDKYKCKLNGLWIPPGEHFVASEI